MTQPIDGRVLAERIREKVKTRAQALDPTPTLAVMLVGEDPASHLYVNLKQRACEEAGIGFVKQVYDADVSEEELLSQIQTWNENPLITGILVQLPLPTQNANRIIKAIDPNKDVDGFHPENLRRLQREENAIASAVALGIMKLIEEPGVELSGLQAGLVCSELFGTPLSILLKERGVTSEILSPDLEDLGSQTQTKDVLIVATGRPRLIQKEMIKPGAILIDVGTTKVHGKLMGDIDPALFEDEIEGFQSPVPGGVGPLTVAMLLVNILKAFQMQNTTS